MAATTDYLSVRCPYCLFEKQVPKSTKTTAELSCGRCQRHFQFQNALPLKTQSTAAATLQQKKTISAYQRDNLLFWVLGLPICILIFLFVNSQGYSMKGPSFIIMYVVLFAALRFLVFLLRSVWWDTLGIAIYGFLVFEAVGASRFIYGYFFANMHKFGFLIAAMFIGGALFFTRYESNNRYRGKGSGSTYNSCSSCGGGCGSGCGGGGGCGGCGG